ncbi:MAG: ABC transporter substrate-binding protein [Acidobacteria bacterium]|nr:ABC transporter substrate-binding protein [Acidobacteriota bacterium]
MTPRQAWRLLLLLPLLAACAVPARPQPHHLVVGVGNAPVNLDPGVGIDEASQRIHQLVFSSLMKTAPDLRIVPDLATSLHTDDGREYRITIPAGVRFHDGRELTSADIVYTFRRFLDPAFVSSRKGAYRDLQSVEAIDRYTAVLRLRAPSAAFPTSLTNMGIVPEESGPALARTPIGSGPYRLVTFVPDDRVELEAFNGYYRGAPANSGIVVKVVPDETMRGLELRNGSVDLIVNDLSPDLVHSLERQGHLQVVSGPGTDYAYVGLNLRDPVLADVRVRRALSHAINRADLVRYLRRGLARETHSIIPSMSWAHATDLPAYGYDPAKAMALLDEAGYRDPDGDGPAARLSLTLKTSTTEAYRLQAAVLQQQMKAVGIALDLRSYEFATLFADVVGGNVQIYTLIFVGSTDPDILRRVFHSTQVPPAGFNRAHYRNADVDALLDRATAAQTEARRRAFYNAAERLIARDAPMISLWVRTNVAVGQANLEGITLSPLGDFEFLKDVRRR